VVDCVNEFDESVAGIHRVAESLPIIGIRARHSSVSSSQLLGRTGAQFSDALFALALLFSLALLGVALTALFPFAPIFNLDYIGGRYRTFPSMSAPW
jgi:hypothetical protein